MTEHQNQDLLVHLVDDKVRVHVGSDAAQRGVICQIDGKIISVRLSDGHTVYVTNTDITNYSLAARRAWSKSRKRAGRPKAEGPSKRTVSLRIDNSLWERLGYAVQQGLIQSRTQAVHDWIEEHLDRMMKDNTHKE